MAYSVACKACVVAVFIATGLFLSPPFVRTSSVRWARHVVTLPDESASLSKPDMPDVSYVVRTETEVTLKKAPVEAPEKHDRQPETKSHSTPEQPDQPDVYSPPKRNEPHRDTTPFKTADLLLTKFDINQKTDDETFYAELLKAQLEVCGDLCDPQGRSHAYRQGPIVGTRQANVHCDKLFATDLLEAASPRWPPPATMPRAMEADYLKLAQGQKNYYTAEKYSGSTAQTASWTVELVEGMIKKAKAGDFAGNYGKAAVEGVAQAAKKFKGKSVLVIGSENPWVEALLLWQGARHVYTLEYGSINSTHPQISTFTPTEFNELYRQRKMPVIEGMVTYSSLEHSGLGRYGDLLAPWGDVVQVAKTWCILPPGATVAIGVEGSFLPSKRRGVKGGGTDKVYWNLHRKYGHRRMPFLFTNFEIQSYVRTTQSMFVAEKLG